MESHPLERLRTMECTVTLLLDSFGREDSQSKKFLTHCHSRAARPEPGPQMACRNYH